MRGRGCGGGFVCVQAFTFLLYSLYHTEYWLGGRWFLQFSAWSQLFVVWSFIIHSFSFYVLLPAGPLSLPFLRPVHIHTSINTCGQCGLSAPQPPAPQTQPPPPPTSGTPLRDPPPTSAKPASFWVGGGGLVFNLFVTVPMGHAWEPSCLRH